MRDKPQRLFVILTQ